MTYTITDKTAKTSDTVTINQSDPGFASPFDPNKHITSAFVEFHSHIPNDPSANAPFPGPYTLHESNPVYRDGTVSNIVPNPVPAKEEPQFNY